MALSSRGSSTVQPKVHKVCFIRKKKRISHHYISRTSASSDSALTSFRPLSVGGEKKRTSAGQGETKAISGAQSGARLRKCWADWTVYWVTLLHNSRGRGGGGEKMAVLSESSQRLYWRWSESATLTCSLHLFISSFSKCYPTVAALDC